MVLLLPKFRKALWLNGFALAVIAAIYLPIMFIASPGIIVILIAIGVVAEMGMRYVVAAVLQVAHGRAKHKTWKIGSSQIRFEISSDKSDSWCEHGSQAL